VGPHTEKKINAGMNEPTAPYEQQNFPPEIKTILKKNEKMKKKRKKRREKKRPENNFDQMGNTGNIFWGIRYSYIKTRFLNRAKVVSIVPSPFCHSLVLLSPHSVVRSFRRYLVMSFTYH
jgi:hypothetical protein